MFEDVGSKEALLAGYFYPWICKLIAWLLIWNLRIARPRDRGENVWPLKTKTTTTTTATTTTTTTPEKMEDGRKLLARFENAPIIEKLKTMDIDRYHNRGLLPLHNDATSPPGPSAWEAPDTNHLSGASHAEDPGEEVSNDVDYNYQNAFGCNGVWGSLSPGIRPCFQIFQPKTVEMRSIGTLQPHQPKPVQLETVVPNRTWP